MKIAAQLVMAALLLAGGPIYAADTSVKCGGMEKMGPQKIFGIPLEKIQCDEISGAMAKKLGMAPNRQVTFLYKSASGQLADLSIYDYRKDPNSVFISGIRSSAVGPDSIPKFARKSIEDSAKAGSIAAKESLKEMDAAQRIISLLAADDCFVTFNKGTNAPGGFKTIVLNDVLVDASYPASNIDDAVNKAKELFNATNFKLLNSVDPL